MVIGHAVHPHPHRKFHIFLITVVVGAILLLVLFNDKGEFSLLTGSSIGLIDNTSLDIKNVDTAKSIDSNTGASKVLRRTATGEINFQLN